MGKVEKVIVLSVLFLIALILVVSLTVDDPLNKTNIAEAGSRERKAAVEPSELAKAGGAAPAPLLSAVVNTPEAAPVATPNGNTVQPAGTPTVAAQPPAAVPTPPVAVPPVVEPTAATVPVLPAGALLKRLDGLEDSLLQDMKLYTWKEGDDLQKVAQHFYGDRNKFTVLRRSNEGHTDIKPGEKIFIPVFDASGASAVRETPVAGAKKGEKAAPKAVVADAGKKIHVVKEGESLWKIAKSELGDGNRWKEIFELNRDVLAKPESVHKGMRLRIP